LPAAPSLTSSAKGRRSAAGAGGFAGCRRAQDRDQEIERLLALGARRVDIEQAGTESWTALADPEGNEFCAIRPKETLTR